MRKTLTTLALGMMISATSFAFQTTPEPATEPAAEPATTPATTTAQPTEYPTLPIGTIIFVKATKDIYAPNFKAGDHFFVELDKDITSKGKVLIPKGTLIQMEVLVSENSKRRASKFGITVGGFIIDNFVQLCKTEAKLVQTEGNAKGTLRKAAIGAGVGAAFDGGEGAGKGAAIGAAAGLLKPGTVIHFPAGTQGTFQLEQPLQVTWL